MAIETLPEPSIPITTPFRPGLGFLTASPIIAAATICLALVILSAILAPWLSPHDPLLLAPAQRLKPASAQFLLGTDGYGRDVLSRILYGGRISLLVGLGAAGVRGRVALFARHRRLRPRRAVANSLWRTDLAADRPWSSRRQRRHRPCDRPRLRLLQMGRCRDDAGDGRIDGDPEHPAR